MWRGAARLPNRVGVLRSRSAKTVDRRPTDETEGTSERRSIRRVLLRRAIPLAITAIGLYIVWPALIDVFSSWPRLLTLQPAWIIGSLGAELASFAALWELQRIALRSDGWFLVVTSQLAGNAFSRIVPGGAPAGAALQYRMLTVGGLDGASTAVGLTTVSLLTTATTFALPVLSIPAILSGIPVDEKLSNAAWLGLAIFVLLFAVGVAMLVSHARPSLVLLAYVVSQVLGIIPITPGGLGFVEAGLATTLGLAGVSGARAVLATLAYRMVSYWLPIIAGSVAYPVFRHRYRTS